MEEELKIVEVDGDIITFQIIKTDTINKADLAVLANSIEKLKREIEDSGNIIDNINKDIMLKNDKIAEIESTIAFANNVVNMANDFVKCDETDEQNVENDTETTNLQ